MPAGTRAVLFDLDGTLINTIEDIADSMNQALERLGRPRHPVEDYKYLVGRGVEHLVVSALPECDRGGELVDQGIRLFKKDYEIHWRDKSSLYPGIGKMLDDLSDLGVRMAILSNKPDQYTKVVCDTWFQSWKLDEVLGARADVPLKPSPIGALRLAALMKLEPSEFIYVGDSGVDMETALAAGMHGIGALWGYRTSEELLNYGAKELIDSPAALIPIAQKRFGG